MKKFLSLAFVLSFIGICSIFAGCNVSDADKIKITFDSNGGSIVQSQSLNKGDKIKEPVDCTRLGYTLDGWYLDDEKWVFIGYSATESMTLTAKWILNTYRINYELNTNDNYTFEEAVSSYTIEDKNIVLTEPKRLGYLFEGWYLENNFLTKVNEINVSLCQDITLYAKWSDTLIISSVNDFINFTKNPNLTKKVKLDCNLDFGNQNIFSINNFEGEFDGNGHILSNYIIEGSSEYVGLFKTTRNATIKNLGIENYIINNNIERNVCGGLIAEMIAGIVENCYTKNGIFNLTTTLNTNKISYVGALIGCVESHALEGTTKSMDIIIKNCYSMGEIKTTGYIGGLIGIVDGYGTYSSPKNKIIISNCYSDCNIESIYNSETLSSKVGGLISEANGEGVEIKNCFSTGNLKTGGMKSTISKISALCYYDANFSSVIIENCYSSNNRLFIENDVQIDNAQVRDYEYINFADLTTIIKDFQQIWESIWDFSSPLPNLKIFILEYN